MLNDIFGFTGGLGFLRGVIKDLVLVLLMGVLFLASIVITDVFGWVKIMLMVPVMPGQWIHSVVILLSIGLSTAFFFIPYRYFPHRRVPVGAALAGAILASLLWEAAKQLFRWYILSFGVYDQVYGPLGVLVALSMFAYYSGVVFILGAEFTAALMDQPRPRVSRAAGRACASVWRPDRQCSLPKGEVTMLKDKVAVVTGAARGIGREIALLMARNGARVVVNDYGGAADGAGGARAGRRGRERDQGPRRPGGGELRLGGEHGGRQEHRPCRARPFRPDRRGRQQRRHPARPHDLQHDRGGVGRRDRHPPEGHFSVTRAAAPHMRERKWGRLINMTSTSGLVGNVGQANYAAAKLGIVGFTKVVALDMARYNVTANCISPFAWTRMIGTIPTETEAQKARVEKIKKMGPEHIAPVAVFLASDAAKEVTGQVFGVRGKELMLFGHMRPVMRVHHDLGWTPERLAEMFPGTLRHHLAPLDTSGQYFNYDPLV